MRPRRSPDPGNHPLIHHQRCQRRRKAAAKSQFSPEKQQFTTESTPSKGKTWLKERLWQQISQKATLYKHAQQATHTKEEK
jgi:hypothetical protein